MLVASALVLAAGLAVAQKQKREPLNEAQIDKIREAAIYPNQRLELYVQFLNERAERIKQLTPRAKGQARAGRLEEELEDFTTLMDELSSNLDQYGERKADIRKALKTVNETAAKWMAVLHGLAGEEGFELARKEALESADDLADTARRLASEQEEYFKTHKDERGQERTEPKDRE
jgi:ABC-type transporter Mla subunit MlaD